MNNNCAFCDRTKFEERLVFENDEWYVVATLGQITDGGYLLVIPKEHIPCLGALNENQERSMRAVVKEACRALSLEYQKSTMVAPYPVITFEHGIVGQTIQHAHLHILPTVVDITPKIIADFPEAITEELLYASHIQKLYGKRPQPYLYWTIPDNTAMVCWNPPAPPQYLRLILAELLGKPERGNWKNMDPNLDKQLGKETVARLKSYFNDDK